MGLMIEFRDEEQYNEIMEKAHEAKEVLCDLCEALESAGEDNGMSEPEPEPRGGNYRNGMGNYRGGNYRSGGYRRRVGRYSY